MKPASNKSSGRVKTQELRKSGHQKSFDAIRKTVYRPNMGLSIFAAEFSVRVFTQFVVGPERMERVC